MFGPMSGRDAAFHVPAPAGLPPSLPDQIATAVRGHFADLAEWLRNVLILGVRQGSMRLDRTPEVETEDFMAAVYGAMLVARAFDDPDRFARIIESLIARIRF